ncbi:pentatricopeptide repeat-containing protein At1g71210, mitochondrial [Elaeis guineensis]|uniref:Pentatricopeptide repeat-containing protein At1g71210, mitochondrial n=1 Tax=Elaeis guineensis var. tenera TaxID=51953 RepID=A0A6I9RZ07_ELAGV|nr:pentatricopeptide repeat-containing protein At1g71210, mitochondrial [Elaeis guineensis]XP_010934879.1 pentatricopeptide repeat-containing protein At1g71210, mitochondrial [Elaeis guineensis]
MPPLFLLFKRSPSKNLFKISTFRSLPLLLPFSTSAAPLPFSPLLDSKPSSDPNPSFDSSLLAASVKDWFRLGADPLSPLDRIYAALAGAPDESSLDATFDRLRIPLSESLVLQTLRHRPHPAVTPPSAPLLLLRLRFFDWSGHQPGYRHSRAAYHAVFRLLSRARLVSVVLDWLRIFSPSSCHPFLLTSNAAAPHPRFHETLIVGYAVAGKPELALQLLARMRFHGLDLDAFSYHVLLNSFVEASIFDFADSILAHVAARGLFGPVTACIKMKSLCRQGRLDDAEAYLRELESSGLSDYRAVAGRMVGTLVRALCRDGRFEAAGRLVDEFGSAEAYGAWVADLLATGRLDAALEFLGRKRTSEDYIPETIHYSQLVTRLLRGNRLGAVYDVLVEMMEEGIPPDRATMNAALCFFCKAGLVDVAVQLYNSRMDLGINPTEQVYNHLIIALCQEGSIDRVCQVLEESMQHGYFPGRQTFNIIASMLIREGKLDKMRKLLDGALQRDVKPATVVFARYISALCKAGDVEEACLVPQMVGKENTGLVRYRSTYINLIQAFIALRRVDVLPRLIIEMQEIGHSPSRSLYRDVVCCLCEMGKFSEVLELLNKQLGRNELDPRTCCNYFINGAGHAKKPEMAREIYSRMENAGIEPQIESKVLVLQSYLKSKRIGDALSFFYYLREKKEPTNKLYNAFISGLCEAGMPEQAMVFWREVRDKGLIPSLQCYEELVLRLCCAKDYDVAVKVLEDFSETGRPVSAFICNVLLLHSLKSQELLWAWVRSRNRNSEVKPVGMSEETKGAGQMMLGNLIAAFSGGIRMRENMDKVEELVERFFPVDIYTYNMLLRGLSMAGRMDYACDLFQRICKKGYEPNRFSFDIIVHGFCKHGKRKEAERWMYAMYQNGFHPTWYTIRIYNNTS